jgi:8-oxo-dGTP diphosphatase
VSDPTIRAAGGVIVRSGADPEVLVVHRPRYDDWSLPKGKLQPGESEAEAAVREIREETGYTARIEREVGRVRYLDSKGRDKEVVYFVMRPEGDQRFEPGDEVDVVRWIRLADAERVLSYPRDARIVADAVGR